MEQNNGTHKMDMQKLQKELTFDEGCVYKIYNDHLGYATFGIGHLITEKDPEHGLPIDYILKKTVLNIKVIHIKCLMVLYIQIKHTPQQVLDFIILKIFLKQQEKGQ